MHVQLAASTGYMQYTAGFITPEELCASDLMHEMIIPQVHASAHL